MFISENEKLMQEWDYEKNNIEGLNPEKLTDGSSKKAWWICSKKHSWKANIASRKNGRGCPYCSNNKILKGYNDLKTTDPELAKEWDYEKNKENGLFVDQVGRGSTKRVAWICPKGHSYEMPIEKRTARGSNCPYCSGHRFKSGYNDLYTLFPNVAKEWHPVLNGNLKPIDIPAKSYKKYWWLCPLGHEYQATAHDRTMGHTNCPVCNRRKQTSFPEQMLYFYVKKIYPNAINSYREIFDNSMELDVYIPDINLGIEYDGKAFHSSKEQLNRDQKKYEICQKNRIKLLRIKEGKYSLKNIPASDYAIYIENPKDTTEISQKIQMLLDYIDPTSNMFTRKNPFQIESEICVDLEKNREEILSNYLTNRQDSLAVTRPEVAEMWDYTKNGKLTPGMFSMHSNESVYWKCPICGHEWKAQINSMTRPGRRGCAVCSPKIRGKEQTKKALEEKSLETAPKEILEEFNYEKNDILPSQITVGSNQSIWWKCKICGCEWTTTPRNRIAQHSKCPHCTGRVPLPGVDDLATMHPEVLIDWDYEINDLEEKYPEQFLSKSGKKVHWKCHICGYRWECVIREKVQGRLCPNCKKNKTVKR